MNLKCLLIPPVLLHSLDTLYCYTYHRARPSRAINEDTKKQLTISSRHELADLAKRHRRSASRLFATSCPVLMSSCSVVRGWSTSEQGGEGRHVRGDQEDTRLRLVHEAQPLELVYRRRQEDRCQTSWYVVSSRMLTIDC